jgi:UDP-N-acetylmuramoyl-tripeptide--D-alanyl-D-alanine ligase
MTLDEILQATGGTLVSGPATRTFTRLFTDSRQVSSGGLFIALRGEQQDGHAFIGQALERGAGGVVCQLPPQEAVPTASIVTVSSTREALFKITRFRLTRLDVPIVAITGSSGKTTTKELIAHVLGRRMRVHRSAGNLNTYTGVPMTVFEMDDRTRVLVMEYAMSRQGEIAELAAIAPPSLAVVLNVQPAHVGLLGSIDAVAEAKRELVEGLAAGGVAILNADDPRVRAMAVAAPRSVLYGLAEDAAVRAEEIEHDGIQGSSFRLVTGRGEAQVRLPLPGAHNVSNALAAAAVALELGFDAEAVAKAVEGFGAPQGRGNRLSGRAGAVIIDDSYNANPGSMDAALATLRMVPSGALRVAVLGEMLELGDHAEQAHDELGRLAARSADRLIALGEHASRVVEAARRGGLQDSAAVVASDNGDAVRLLQPVMGPQTYVLVKGSHSMRMEEIVDALKETG